MNSNKIKPIQRIRLRIGDLAYYIDKGLLVKCKIINIEGDPRYIIRQRPQVITIRITERNKERIVKTTDSLVVPRSSKKTCDVIETPSYILEG